MFLEKRSSIGGVYLTANQTNWQHLDQNNILFVPKVVKKKLEKLQLPAIFFDREFRHLIQVFKMIFIMRLVVPRINDKTFRINFLRLFKTTACNH